MLIISWYLVLLQTIPINKLSDSPTEGYVRLLGDRVKEVFKIEADTEKCSKDDCRQVPT